MTYLLGQTPAIPEQGNGLTFQWTIPKSIRYFILGSNIIDDTADLMPL